MKTVILIGQNLPASISYSREARRSMLMKSIAASIDASKRALNHASMPPRHLSATAMSDIPRYEINNTANMRRRRAKMSDKRAGRRLFILLRGFSHCVLRHALRYSGAGIDIR